MVDEAAQSAANEAAEKSFDTSDPEQVNEARKKAGRKRKDQLEVVQALMEHAQGRAWFYGLLEVTHIFTSSFVNGDPYQSAFKEGERNIGLRILADIQAAAPDQYVVMIKEAKSNG